MTARPSRSVHGLRLAHRLSCSSHRPLRSVPRLFLAARVAIAALCICLLAISLIWPAAALAAAVAALRWHPQHLLTRARLTLLAGCTRGRGSVFLVPSGVIRPRSLCRSRCCYSTAPRRLRSRLALSISSSRGNRHWALLPLMALLHGRCGAAVRLFRLLLASIGHYLAFAPLAEHALASYARMHCSNDVLLCVVQPLLTLLMRQQLLTCLALYAPNRKTG